jgi:hypothetical protein
MEEGAMHEHDHQSSEARVFDPLSPRQRLGLVMGALAVVVFGCLVELRSAFLKRHMTDLGVYLRTAWAARVGKDIYDITDDNGWHYQYPPLFALVMTPLADPPPGVERAAMLPFGVSVAIWYTLSLACLAFAVHQLASALEQTSTDPRVRALPRGCRRWWALRVLPVLACIVPVGHTLMRGQVNLLLLALLCAMAAALVRGHTVRAGLWLAGAVCLKVIPAFLLLVPVWRREVRCLAGFVVGVVIGLALVPAAVFGVPRTVEYYREYADKLLLPGVGRGADQSRARELIDVTASDSQSLLAVIHNTMYPLRDTRPPRPSDMTRDVVRALGLAMTAVTLLAAGFGRLSGPRLVLLLGNLVVVMLLISPVCHLHYFCLCVPVVMGLLVTAWEDSVLISLRWELTPVLWLNLLAQIAPNLQGLEVMRDGGSATYGVLLLWGLGCLVLWRGRRSASRTLARHTEVGIAGAAVAGAA